MRTVFTNDMSTKVTVTFCMLEVPDSDPDLSYLEQDYSEVTDPTERFKYLDQDKARRDAFNRGEWACVGIKARATIRIHREKYITEYTLDSPGIWGIEEDSDKGYLADVFSGECAVLKADIEALKLWGAQS